MFRCRILGFLVVPGWLGLAAAAVSAQPTSPEPSAQAMVGQWPPVRRLKSVQSPDWNDYNVYPLAARRLGQEGRIAVEALVDRGGVPRACRIRVSSGHAELDSGTCSLVLQMRFADPVDEHGDKTEATYLQTFTWQLTKKTPFLPTTLTADITMADGRVDACRLSGTGPLLAFWSRTACRIFAEEAEYYFGVHRYSARHATVDVALAPATTPVTPHDAPGILVAERHTNFEVNGSGDPIACRNVSEHGFGTPRIDHAGPCGFFLTGAWFARATASDSARSGLFVIEVRVDRP